MMLETALSARDRRYRRAVGLLILATLGVLFAMLWMANRQIGVFSQTYRLHGFTDNARSLQKTTPVTLAGLKIGEVRALEMTDDNQIRIDLVLDRRYQTRIRRDSAAQVKTDWLGNARIEINMGMPEETALWDGAQIAVQRAPDLDILIRQAQQEMVQVGAVLSNVRALTEELKKPDGGLLGTLDAVARMTREFSQSLSGHLERIDVILRDAAQLSGQLGPLLHNLTQVAGEMNRSARDLAVVSERIRQGQGVLGGLTDSGSLLSRHLLASARKLDATMTELEKLTGQLPRYTRQTERILQNVEQMTLQLAEASAQAPGLLDKSRGIAEEVDDMVGAIKRSPLLRTLNPPPAGVSVLEAPRDMEWAPP